MCKDIAQFEGDDANSTDLVLEMKVEVDGQWGPYLECNPLNTTDPLGAWHCQNGLTPTAPPNYPKECSADNFRGYYGYCSQGEVKSTLQNVTLADCCDAAQKKGHEPMFGIGGYNYFANSTCDLLAKSSHWPSKCENTTISGVYEAPTNSC